MYSEVRFHNKYVQVLNAIANANINVEAVVLDSIKKDYRVVISNRDLPTVVSIIRRSGQPSCISPLQRTSLGTVPGQLVKILNPNQSMIYFGEGNNAFIKNKGGVCNY